MRHIAIVLCFAAATLSAAASRADDYPSRNITLVIPFPPGGSTSVVARAISEAIGANLGRSIVIENRGGAGGATATRAVARAEPDGYTILMGYTGTLAVAPTLQTNAGYDPRKDFAPIGQIGAAPMLMLAHPSTPYKTAADVIEAARKEPGALNYASAGVGTASHMGGELFTHMAGVKLTHIPYKGTGPAVNDLLGGHVRISFTPMPPVIGPVQAGLLRALAVTSSTRAAVLPEVPTIAESGLPGYESVLTYGLLAPAGTPEKIIGRLNAALRDALAAPSVREHLAKEGIEAAPSAPDDYAVTIDREEQKWAALVKAMGLRTD
ncbi:MAG: putative tricarboxylic transport rane protein [Variibacter sp.]|nr:putative tricarboxylic transport rane protein [Variibacter sp.]